MIGLLSIGSPETINLFTCTMTSQNTMAARIFPDKTLFDPLFYVEKPINRNAQTIVIWTLAFSLYYIGGNIEIGIADDFSDLQRNQRG
jgi:hypothetical protein